MPLGPTGDPRPDKGPSLQARYDARRVVVLQRAFSTAMSRLRESVEWGFALVLRDWAFLDRKKNLKLFKQPIGKLFFVGALLANMKTCVTASHALDGYGNQIALKFGVSPPSLHDYLHRF